MCNCGSDGLVNYGTVLDEISFSDSSSVHLFPEYNEGIPAAEEGRMSKYSDAARYLINKRSLVLCSGGEVLYGVLFLFSDANSFQLENMLDSILYAF